MFPAAARAVTSAAPYFPSSFCVCCGQAVVAVLVGFKQEAFSRPYLEADKTEADNGDIGTPGQVLSRPTSFHGYIGYDQVSLQGHVDARFPEAD